MKFLSSLLNALLEISKALNGIALQLETLNTRLLEAGLVPPTLPPTGEEVPEVDFFVATDEALEEEAAQRERYQEHTGKRLHPWDDVPPEETWNPDFEPTLE